MPAEEETTKTRKDESAKPGHRQVLAQGSGFRVQGLLSLHPSSFSIHPSASSFRSFVSSWSLPFQKAKLSIAWLVLGLAALGLPSGLTPGALAQCVGGTCRPAAAPHAAVVRIANALPGGITCYGSGTLVGKEDTRGLVLTCSHLFRQGAGTVTVAFPSGRQHGARLLDRDQAWDLAALEIDEPPAQPVAIAGEYPRPGESLQSCGYGPDGRYQCQPGRALGYAKTAASTSHETLQVSGAARDGDSGGPVLNARGELVAVVWGTDGRTVEGTYCGRIRKFLAGLASRGRQPPGVSGGADDTRRLTPPAPTLPGPSTPPTPWGDRIEDLRRRLADQEQTFGQRIERIEKAVAIAAGLKERIEKAESAVGAENLRRIVREVAGGLVAEGAPGLLEKALPAVMAALGWTGPPAIAAVLAARVLAAVLRRRRDERRQGRREPDAGTKAAPAPQPFPVVVETPPPPQNVVHERTYVPYQEPNEQLVALLWAQDQYVQRNPGARETIEAIRQFAEQYRSGMQAKR